jgi:hypothetical protein
VSVAVCPGFNVRGAVIPEAENKEPATEIAEIDTGAVPDDVRVTVFFTVCPTVTSPKLTLVELTLRAGVPELACAKLTPHTKRKRQAAMTKMDRIDGLRKTSPSGRGTSGSPRRCAREQIFQ